jgi:acyl carrier protein
MDCETTAIREIIAQHGRLSVDAHALDVSEDLYRAGLTSLATVGVMLALEDHFNIEFPRTMLGRKTFESIESIADAVGELVGSTA